MLSVPLVPGTGVGNTLAWEDGGLSPDEGAVRERAWNALSVTCRTASRPSASTSAELAPPRIGVFEDAAFIVIHVAADAGRHPRARFGRSPPSSTTATWSSSACRAGATPGRGSPLR